MRAFAADYLQHVDNPIIKAVLLLVFYILVAKIADIFIDKAVRRLAKFTKSELDDKIIDLTHRPVFFTVLFIGCMHAVSILNPSENILFYTHGILYSLLTVIWVVCLVRISNILIEEKVVRVVDVTGLGKEVTPLVENVWKVLIIVAALMVILSIWKVNITPLIASAGIAGVAIALAAKDTLANFFGGISIFLDKPYKIGDFIVLEGGERGEVVNIGIRSTRIKTRDDILISIPNSIIANAKIINESAPVPNFRMRIPASVAYGSDIDKVERILLDIAEKNENILKTPEPRVRFRTFGESSLNFELLCWASEPVVRGITIHQINREIYKRFHEEGVVIPFPHRTVYVREERDWES
jgi:small-conductance mechanosensitive channel